MTAAPMMNKSRALKGSRKRRGQQRFRLDTHVFYLLSRILASRNRALNRSLAGFGIDYPRWRVLGVLSEHPGASMLKLAELTSVDRTTLAHTVRMMVEEGLVQRIERKSDRRSVELRLTRRGSAVLRRILPLVLAQNDHALKGFSSGEADRLRALLGRVLANLEDN